MWRRQSGAVDVVVVEACGDGFGERDAASGPSGGRQSDLDRPARRSGHGQSKAAARSTRADSRTPERPSGESEARRKATRFVSAGAGNSMRAKARRDARRSLRPHDEISYREPTLAAIGSRSRRPLRARRKARSSVLRATMHRLPPTVATFQILKEARNARQHWPISGPATRRAAVRRRRAPPRCRLRRSRARRSACTSGAQPRSKGRSGGAGAVAAPRTARSRRLAKRRRSRIRKIGVMAGRLTETIVLRSMVCPAAAVERIVDPPIEAATQNTRHGAALLPSPF